MDKANPDTLAIGFTTKRQAMAIWFTLMAQFSKEKCITEKGTAMAITSGPRLLKVTHVMTNVKLKSDINMLASGVWMLCMVMVNFYM